MLYSGGDWYETPATTKFANPQLQYDLSRNATQDCATPSLRNVNTE